MSLSKMSGDRKKAFIFGYIIAVLAILGIATVVLVNVVDTSPAVRTTTCQAEGRPDNVKLIPGHEPSYLPRLDYTPPSVPKPSTAPANAVLYTVRPGDCLFTIAYKFRVPGGWQTLYNYNRAKIGSNPNLIRIGLVLTIPSGSATVPRPVPRPAPVVTSGCPSSYGRVPPSAVPNCDNISWWKAHASYQLNYIISHESSWNPYAVNPYSGTYGLGQFMPGNYFAPYPGAPVHTQILQIIRYCNSRYGGVYNAYIFWINHHWY